jgi:rhodanese-related sulfurtransferase
MQMFGFSRAANQPFETINGAEAAARVKAGARLVDVRERNEFSAGHVEGAINVPLSAFASHAHLIPKDAPVILYCAAGMRSERALGVCANLDLGVTTHVAGGISALARAGMRITQS